LGGRIVETGGVELARELHQIGYDRIRKSYPDAAEINDQNVATTEGELVG
jgi:Fe-S cluster assembly ATP-binding protein